MAQTMREAPPVDSVGPDYRPQNEKPTATISTQVRYENVHILSPTPQLIALLTYDWLLPFTPPYIKSILNVCVLQYDSR